MYISLVYSAGYSCPILIALEFSGQIFEKSTNIKFHENPSSESRVVPGGRPDMTKLIVAFHSFEKALKKKKSTASFDGSQASPARPAGNSSSTIKTCLDQRRNNPRRGNPN